MDNETAHREFFHLLKNAKDSGARTGEIHTTHGIVPTPAFMPVGSQATVKAIAPDDLKEIGIRLILSNTYHLYLRPGIDIIEKLGGLHRFMSWDGSILTDSGGYQIFSLARLRDLSDEGVTFRSHIDGSQHLITPELDIRYQEALGADIIMALDVCPSVQEDKAGVAEATERTHKWAERCLKSHTRQDQALFAIVQGGFHPELRQQSAAYLTSLNFPGYAIGGLSIGETKPMTFEMLDVTLAVLPLNKPRYLMGVGAPEDIVNSVARGVDIFDSVLPTRVARNGGFYTWQGRINIRNAVYSQTGEPIDPACGCYTCRNFSAAYLHHLFRSEELLAYRLATIHNLKFMHDFMVRIRETITAGTFTDFKSSFLNSYRTTDEQVRLAQKQKWLETWSPREKGQAPPVE